MKRLAIAVAVLLAACTWNNSLYQARVLSGDAVRAERDGLPGQARLIWGQVIDKADSAYARSPQGKGATEALWLGGHAAARSNDCVRAVTSLQTALPSSRGRPWEQQLLLDLAECQETLGSSSASSLYASLLARATDPRVKREARLRQGHVLVTQGHWEEALSVLANLDTVPARIDRGMAFASLNRISDAESELAPLLAASDTTVRWISFVDVLAPKNSAATDALLERVLTFPGYNAARRSALVLDAARFAYPFDLDAADRRLSRLNEPGSAATAQGRLLHQQIMLTRPVTPEQMRVPLDSMAHVDFADAGISGRRVVDLLRFGRLIVALNDSTRAGAPRGDLVTFALGELARDSLGSVPMASWFFGRVERDWPQSPYVAKALFARMALQPDSADALRARAVLLAGNPYIAAANGNVAARVQLARLEDSLSRFTSHLWVGRSSASVVTERE